ncbi:MAG TPA: starch-binding protein, partial [Rhodospirillales bacterium]|nr:starch-binding protein [Rhodospirillales bacterium]
MTLRRDGWANVSRRRPPANRNIPTQAGEAIGAMPLVVHFKRPAGWGPTVNIHFWDAVPAEPSTTWPGVPMRA